jgi:hypothetical protein
VHRRGEPRGLRTRRIGKIFLLEALGQHAVEAGLHVAWFTLESFRVLVRRHRTDDTVTKAISRIQPTRSPAVRSAAFGPPRTSIGYAPAN